MLGEGVRAGMGKLDELSMWDMMTWTGFHCCVDIHKYAYFQNIILVVDERRDM